MKYLIAVFLILTGLSAFGQSKSIQFKPTVYYNNFSDKFPVVLKVQEGDTIKSESVDAGGTDKNGERIAKRGNPVTGPFFIDGASPGDIVAITLTSVSLNRDNATTVGGFVKRSMPMDAIKEVYGRNARLVKWKLDITNGYAMPELASERLKDFKVPLNPFIGCLGLAAPSESKDPLTYFADVYGGNMDFYKVTKGATIYLPVFHEGALLYIGDGHAVQGDGELNGDALETSMDFAFVARVIKGKTQIKFPRIEDAEHLVAIAMDKTLEQALKKATLGLLEWLQNDYKLTLTEATQVIGPLMEYRIPTLAGPKVEVAAMVKKKYLARLKTMN
jgi:acetamidase/formamidase